MYSSWPDHIFSPHGPIWPILHPQSAFCQRVYSDLEQNLIKIMAENMCKVLARTHVILHVYLSLAQFCSYFAQTVAIVKECKMTWNQFFRCKVKIMTKNMCKVHVGIIVLLALVQFWLIIHPKSHLFRSVGQMMCSDLESILIVWGSGHIRIICENLSRSYVLSP